MPLSLNSKNCDGLNMTWEFVLFYFFGIFAVLSALMVIFLNRPVYSVISLVLTMFCLAGLFFLLQAPLVAVIQMIVYTGAVMVLFLFAVMLLNLGKETDASFRTGPARWFAVPLGIYFTYQIWFIIQDWPQMSHDLSVPGRVENIAKLLFTEYLLPFEIISFLLLAAILGTTVLAKRDWK